jgi:hypothetical protein
MHSMLRTVNAEVDAYQSFLPVRSVEAQKLRAGLGGSSRAMFPSLYARLQLEPDDFGEGEPVYMSPECEIWML